MIESLKKTYDFLQDCNFPINKLLEGPKSGSENNILVITLNSDQCYCPNFIQEYVKDNITIAWHALGTVKMGIKGGEGACVCSNFNVLENLQVIDLSMCLVVPRYVVRLC